MLDQAQNMQLCLVLHVQGPNFLNICTQSIKNKHSRLSIKRHISWTLKSDILAF